MFEAEQITGTDFEPNRLIEYFRPPFRKFEFSTPMTPAQSARVLLEIVEPFKTFRWASSGTDRYFEGWLEGDHFKIRANHQRPRLIPADSSRALPGRGHR